MAKINVEDKNIDIHLLTTPESLSDTVEEVDRIISAWERLQRLAVTGNLSLRITGEGRG